MLELETVKDFSNKFIKSVNKIRLLGESFPDQRIIEKILICLLEKYEANISTLEETRDLTQLTVAELINAFQATEQRRSFWLQSEPSSSEATLAANNKGKTIQQPRPFQRQNKGKETANQRGNKMTYGPCIIFKKQGRMAKICWWRSNAQCKVSKQFDHMDKVYKQRNQRQETIQAHEPEELNGKHEYTFTTTCNLATTTKDKWILDSECTNHMCNNRDLFVKFNSRIATKIKAANGQIMEAQGKEDLVIKILKGTIKITNVLYVPNMSKNLLSVPQLMKK
ncbi:uncharacterized protein LOC132799781 [Ziziphus jujuba]|uniref:Uncharacterized protein LOC132799781 n=1 Tax=Ziziphus jujuba TaxID=326968 RepID=A0ABM3ZV94_ZIZJJ|nr:uncharacterized protein LOC132799781 [Ziziphus jujuba]